MAEPKNDRKFLLTATSGHADLYPDVKIAEQSFEHAIEGHGSGYAMLESVVATIADPDAIYDSTTRPGGAVILTNSGTTDHNGHPLQVRVKVLPGEPNSYFSTLVFTPKTPKGKLLRKRGGKP